MAYDEAERILKALTPIPSFPQIKNGFGGRGIFCIYKNLNSKLSPISDFQMGEMSEGQRGWFRLLASQHRLKPSFFFSFSSRSSQVNKSPSLCVSVVKFMLDSAHGNPHILHQLSLPRIQTKRRTSSRPPDELKERLATSVKAAAKNIASDRKTGQALRPRTDRAPARPRFAVPRALGTRRASASTIIEAPGAGIVTGIGRV